MEDAFPAVSASWQAHIGSSLGAVSALRQLEHLQLRFVCGERGAPAALRGLAAQAACLHAPLRLRRCRVAMRRACCQRSLCAAPRLPACPALPNRHRLLYVSCAS